MKGLDSEFATKVGNSGRGDVSRRRGPDDEVAVCLAEAIEILADRARRHGLAEVEHLLAVAAMAARDTAAPATPRENAKPKRGTRRTPA